jgi:homospermidine synthase
MKQSLIHNPMYIYLMILTITVSGGLHVWQTLFDNFAVKVVHLEGHHVGRSSRSGKFRAFWPCWWSTCFRTGQLKSASTSD